MDLKCILVIFGGFIKSILGWVAVKVRRFSEIKDYVRTLSWICISWHESLYILYACSPHLAKVPPSASHGSPWLWNTLLTYKRNSLTDVNSGCRIIIFSIQPNGDTWKALVIVNICCWLNTFHVGWVMILNHFCWEEAKPGRICWIIPLRCHWRTQWKRFLSGFWSPSLMLNPQQRMIGLRLQVERPSFSIDSLKRNSGDGEMDGLSARGKDLYTVGSL